ncbi:MAG TPA: hypothetical protein ENN38_07530 [Actinobacteria bacterium]|nr:hypothetical protein [Actinomycetota bacterium]
MCENGMNYTQLKLVFHQMIVTSELLEKNLTQWKNLMDSARSEHLCQLLEDSIKKTSEAASSLKGVFSEINRLSDEHHHESEVTITKI